jgi:hypothetical protein
VQLFVISSRLWGTLFAFSPRMSDYEWLERYDDEVLITRHRLPRPMSLAEAVTAMRDVEPEWMDEPTPLLVAMVGGRRQVKEAPRSR